MADAQPIAKRRGPPPKGAVAMTSTERDRLSRLAHGAVNVRLSADVLRDLDALARQAGDASRPACIARLVREATLCAPRPATPD